MIGSRNYRMETEMGIQRLYHTVACANESASALMKWPRVIGRGCHLNKISLGRMKVKPFFNLVMWDFSVGCAYQARMKLYVIHCRFLGKLIHLVTLIHKLIFGFAEVYSLIRFIHLVHAVIQSILRGIKAKQWWTIELHKLRQAIKLTLGEKINFIEILCFT